MHHLKAMLLLVLVVFSLSASAQKDLRIKKFNLDNKVAIQGYDPVAYFTQNKAIKGKKEFAVDADGVIYYCSSAENKAKLLKNFKAYEPQYGGWCAYAMGFTGEKVEIDPETFKILDGKLYLFYHTWTNNTLPKWNKDETNLKAKADKNWAAILAKP